jgi:DNA polymerase III subunit epsilon
MDAPLVALDLEGTGAQDRADEAILEIATVPLIEGRPFLASAYTTLINPGRRIPHRPWTSPGLTNRTLAEAPDLAEVEPALAAQLDAQIIVGHNVGIDWRLLHRRCPSIQPAGLIDTLRLARHVHTGEKRNGLTALLERHQLISHVTELAPGSQPHRALWDTIGTALLLPALLGALQSREMLSIDVLRRIAGIPLSGNSSDQPDAQQTSLLDP